MAPEPAVEHVSRRARVDAVITSEVR